MRLCLCEAVRSSSPSTAVLGWCELHYQAMSGGGGGGGGSGGVLNLSNVEEGRGTRSPAEQAESTARPEPTANEVVAVGTRVLRACMFGLPWRRIVASLAYMTTMLCAISLVRGWVRE